MARTVEYATARDRIKQGTFRLLSGLALDGGELDALALACELDAWMQTVIAGAVVEARREGYTWDEIAESLGVSKQAARERFGPMIRSRRSRTR